MSTGKDAAPIVGIGVAACAVCCAGPILGFVAALGLGAAASAALFGTLGLVIAAIVAAVLIPRRRRRAVCAVTDVSGAPVEMAPTSVRTRDRARCCCVRAGSSARSSPMTAPPTCDGDLGQPTVRTYRR